MTYKIKNKQLGVLYDRWIGEGNDITFTEDLTIVTSSMIPYGTITGQARIDITCYWKVVNPNVEPVEIQIRVNYINSLTDSVIVARYSSEANNYQNILHGVIFNEDNENNTYCGSVGQQQTETITYPPSPLGNDIYILFVGLPVIGSTVMSLGAFDIVITQ